MAKFWIRVAKAQADRVRLRRWRNGRYVGYGDKVHDAVKRRDLASVAEFRSFHYRALAEAVEKSLLARLMPTHELWCVWPDTGAEPTGIRGVPGVTSYRPERFARYEWRPITEAA